MKENILRGKTYAFAIRIVQLCKYLNNEKKEFILSRQVLKSGTSIGAQVRESEFGQSKADFVNKMSVALKEANETEYWISLLKDTGYILPGEYQSLSVDCQEIIKLLVASIKTAKKNI